MRIRFVSYFLVIPAVLCSILIGIVIYGMQSKSIQPQSKAHERNFSSLISVKEFGPLVVGGDMPFGGFEGWTFAPHKTIPASAFYVAIVQDDYWCSLENCDFIGALVKTMGGWLQMTNRDVFPDVKGITGLDLKKNNNIKSITIVGDSHSKIAGMYQNIGIQDLLTILRLHPDLAHMGLLKGVDTFGPLKVGEKSPIQPGDPTGLRDIKQTSFPYLHIPTGKKFYVFSLQKKLLGNGYCAFFECEPPNDYPQGSYIEELGGWFSSDGTAETIRAFGLNPDKVAKGEESLVVVTDPNGTIAAIHPGNTFTDILGILSQHKDLVDVEEWYANKGKKD